MEDALDEYIHKSFLHTIVSRRNLRQLKQILELLNDESLDMLTQHMCVYDWITGLKHILSTVCLTQQQLSHALTTACMNGNINIINILLEQRSLVPPRTLLETICGTTPPAKYTTWYVIVDRLLQDDRFNPGINDSAPLRSAVARRDVTIVDRLLQDPRTDPTAPFRHDSFGNKWNSVRARLMEEPIVFWQYSAPEDRQKWYVLRNEMYKQLKIEIILAHSSKCST